MLKLEGDNYKLKSDNDFLKEMLKTKNDELSQAKNKMPTQIIKEVVLEKPV